MSLTNSPSVETYKGYAEALNALDIDRTRTYLHDDLTYQGPVGEIQGADAYLKQVSALGLHQVVRKIFVDGDDVCVLADLSIAKVASTAGHPSVPRCKTLRLRMVSSQRRQDRLDPHYL